MKFLDVEVVIALVNKEFKMSLRWLVIKGCRKKVIYFVLRFLLDALTVLTAHCLLFGITLECSFEYKIKTWQNRCRGFIAKRMSFALTKGQRSKRQLKLFTVVNYYYQLTWWNQYYLVSLPHRRSTTVSLETCLFNRLSMICCLNCPSTGVRLQSTVH